VVIDVDWRLSQTQRLPGQDRPDRYQPDYLAEASASTDLHLVRICNDPIILHYREGQRLLKAEGLAECLEVAPDEHRDGENSAMRYLYEMTGLVFGDDLWDAKFTLDWKPDFSNAA
jgi:hypothetical protein